ncbi:type I secretion system permease/ATPase [Neorhizobium galegae]|uniref:type I secretion system permease/ATPase n=1 Tax=Neorhizobium galegae TaxID=399 RepID=UPI0006220A57|nr:type I secretion system permease/ATPase [Neorhizobium galegae]CDZ56992.1 Type I secretion system ABC transporter, PrtD family [Neorhizobium galegae bv. orientalis]KAB1123038.1 type I secretion system permease/ATPase [Neorhizobium galegae]MCQ1569961.1 type I secretion system permease/ATPase [Neorhizobium galegae]MCQ1807499.1 type I secretion system permease/ATPase [Neorhizobium galegae]MCQ1839181.1 type I secretion system permease/ATPase [Neorhizobium galegae]
MFGSSKQVPSQLRAAAAAFDLKHSIAGIALVSGVINLLTLTSPLFMLQVYDRVLSSGSAPTLVGLAVLAAGLYAFQSLLDILRARVLLRIGERFDRQMSGSVHDAIVRLPLLTRMPGDGLQPLRDLDNVRGFLGGSGPTAFFDLPWMPLYLGICFLFHFWIGVTALIGAVILISLTLIGNVLSQKPIRDTITHNMARNGLMEAARRNAEIVQALGLGKRISLRWQRTNTEYLAANRRAGDVAGDLGGVSKSLRMVLQSAILAVGAYLVIEQEVTAGVMIASSITMGRALAPVDLAISSWKPFLLGRQSWARIKILLAKLPEAPCVMSLPAPERELRLEGITIIPPGEKRPTVANISFTVEAGSGLGIIGTSGSGKSTLSRVIVGAWLPAAGKVRIDGASLDQWDPELLGRHIGYLPQGVELFDGTIAENIARFEDDPDPAAIVAAAKTAGAHELILRFERGYETPIGESGSALSAGQRQRIGLARALYGNPFLVVLDEPNANLDADGEAAVVRAIAAVRERRGIAIVVAHRPSAIGAVDHVLVMDDGRQKALGPRDEVLSKVLKGSRPSGPSGNGFFSTSFGISPLRVIANPAHPATETAVAGRQDHPDNEEPDVRP